MSFSLFQAKIPLSEVSTFLHSLAPGDGPTPEKWASVEIGTIAVGDMVFILDPISAPGAVQGNVPGESEKFRVSQILLIFKKEEGYPMCVAVATEDYEMLFAENVLCVRAEAAHKRGSGFHYLIARPQEALSTKTLSDLSDMQKWTHSGKRSQAQRALPDPVYMFLSNLGIAVDPIFAQQPIDIRSLGYFLFTKNEPNNSSRVPNLRQYFRPVKQGETLRTDVPAEAPVRRRRITTEEYVLKDLPPPDWLPPSPSTKDDTLVGLQAHKDGTEYPEESGELAAEIASIVENLKDAVETDSIMGGFSDTAFTTFDTPSFPAPEPFVQEGNLPLPSLSNEYTSLFEPSQPFLPDQEGESMPASRTPDEGPSLFGLSDAIRSWATEAETPPTLDVDFFKEPDALVLEHTEIDDAMERFVDALPGSLPTDIPVTEQSISATEPNIPAFIAADEPMETGLPEALILPETSLSASDYPPPAPEPIEAVGIKNYEEKQELPLPEAVSVESTTIEEIPASSVYAPAELPTAVPVLSPSPEPQEDLPPQPSPPKEPAPAVRRRRKAGSDGKESLITVVRDPGGYSPAVAGLLDKLEQQAARATAKLEGKLAEIEKELLLDLNSNVTKFAVKGEASTKNILAFKTALYRKLADSSAAAKADLQDVVQTSKKQTTEFLTTSTVALDQAIDQSTSVLVKSFDDISSDAEVLITSAQAELDLRQKRATQGLSEETKTGQAKSKIIGRQHSSLMQSRFDQFKLRLDEFEKDFNVKLQAAAERLSHELSVKQERTSSALRDLVQELLDASAVDLSTASRAMSAQANFLGALVLMPKLISLKQGLVALAQEFREQYKKDAELAGANCLAEFETLLASSSNELENILESANNIKLSLEGPQKKEFDQLLISLRFFIEEKTNEIKELSSTSRNELNQIDKIITDLADPAVLESDKELADTRTAALSKIQQIGSSFHGKINESLNGQIASIEEQKGRMLQEELISFMEEQAYAVRKAAENNLTKIRAAIKKSFNDIQTAQDKYLQ